MTTDGNGAVPPTPSSTTTGSALPSPRNKSKEREAENGGENGKVGEGNDKPLIPDAQLFATWDFESKDYKVPLASSVVVGSASRLHRGKVSREGGGDAAGVGVVASGSASSLLSVGAGGRSKSGMRL